ncbi:MAG: DUF6134 family protein, partial [Pseudomonadota bacterium]
MIGPATALASTGGVRRFEVERDGKSIGFHTISATATDAGLQIDIDIALRIRFLGITAYRYEHQNREIWKDGRLTSLVSKTNDDGTDDFCRLMRDGEVYRVEGSGFTGAHDGAAAPT